jgi:hypothetical protein
MFLWLVTYAYADTRKYELSSLEMLFFSSAKLGGKLQIGSKIGELWELH